MAFKMSWALEQAGFMVTIIDNFLYGFKYLYKSYPHLVILSQRHPFREIIGEFMSFRMASDLPIIVLGENDDICQILERGADAYLNYQASMVELVATVRSLLRSRRLWSPEKTRQRWPYIDIAA